MTVPEGFVPAAPVLSGTLIEAHAHVLQLGRTMGMLDLTACGSPGEMLEMVAAYRSDRVASGASGAVLAQGARPEAWNPPRWPTLDDLDRVCPDDICIAWCFDYHALMANPSALRNAGIERANIVVPNGVVEVDDEGKLTGVALEAAALRIWDALPEPNGPSRRAMLVSALQGLNGLGFRHVDDLKSQPGLGHELRLMHDENPLPMSVGLHPLVEDLPAMAADQQDWACDAVRLAGGKIFVDGTLNSRTAWMLSPYADGRPDHPCGLAMMDQATIEDAVRTCDALGVPMAAHAIGDGAVRAVLDAIEAVNPKTPGFRIEHCELIDDADVPRFAKLGVICSVQPCHLLYDIEALRRAVPDRLDRVLPLRSLIDAGATPGELLIFGSDAPIVRADPGDSLFAATDRRRLSMEPGAAISPEQAITMAEAMQCFQFREGDPGL